MLSRISFITVAMGFALTGAISTAPYANAADAVTSADGEPVPKAATNEAIPLIEIEGEAKLQLYGGIGKPHTTAIFASVEPEITVNLSDSFRLFGHFILEPVEDPIDGKTNYFHSEGLYAEELYAGLTAGNVKFEFGKIDPKFGVASDEAPGIYGEELASNYDFKGALGAAANIFIADNTTGTGDDAVTVKQLVHVSLFTADPTALSRSLFTDRGLYSWSDNRVGNTTVPESFDISYEYSTKNADDDVVGPTIRVAMRRLAARASGVPDEWDLLASGRTAIDLGEEQTLRPIGELTYFVDEGGYRHNAAAATAGLEFQWGDWITSAVASAHQTFGTSGPSDYMVTGSFGRLFKTEVTGEFRVDAGYSNARVDGSTTNIVGLRLHKDFSWNSGSGD